MSTRTKLKGKTVNELHEEIKWLLIMVREFCRDCIWRKGSDCAYQKDPCQNGGMEDCSLKLIFTKYDFFKGGLR